MQDFQDELGSTGQGAGVVLGDRDETRLNHTINLTDGRDTEDVTTFQPTGNAKSYAYLLTSGTASVKGFSAEDPDVVRAQHAQTLGKSRAKPILIVGKYGLAPGTEANFARTLSNTRNCERSLTGVTMADATFALHNSGVLDGKSLHAVFGNAVPNLSEVQKLTFVNADPNAFRGVRATGTTAVFSFGLGIDNAALATGIGALPAYAGRSVAVTGAALTGANPSGARQIAYDGAVDVPQLEAVSGAVDAFVVAGGNSGNYSANGGAPFTLPISEGALQTNLQNQGGAYQGVIVKGSSVGNTSVERHTVNGNGNALSIYGGISVLDKTIATLQTAIRAQAGRASAVVAGTITQAVSAPINGTGSSNNTLGGYPVAAAFDNDEITRWSATGKIASLNYNLGAGNGAVAIAVRIYPHLQDGGGPNDAPRTFNVNGRIGNGAWVNLFSKTNQVYSNTNPVTFAFDNTIAYTEYQLEILDALGQNVSVRKLEFLSGTPASVNLTIAYDAAAANVSDIEALPGVGYVGTSTQPNPNGNANFKFYYPLNATPAAPTATGTGATIIRAALGISPDVIATTIQQATGADVNFAYNVVTESGDGDWVDFDLDSPAGFHLALSVIHAQGIGATLGLVIETADADGAGAPVAGSIAVLHTFAPFGARAYDIVASKTPVKRLVRVRRTVVGAGEFIFALALAPRVA